MSVSPLYDLTTPSTARGLTASLWRQSLEAYVSNNPEFGYRLKSDFIDEQLTTSDGATAQLTGTTAVTAANGWTAQDSAVAGGTYTVSLLNQDGGWMSVDNNTGTADFGVEVGRTVRQFSLPSATSTPSYRTVFEMRYSNTDADRIFAVLTDAAYNTPICGNNVLADVGYIGFNMNEAGDLIFQTSSANGGTTDSATILAAANWTATGIHKLGFAVNADRSVDVVVDGTWYSPRVTLIDPLSLPTGVLAPRFGVSSGNSGTAPTALFDSIDIFCATTGV